jgi:hypothetical protein
MKINKAALDALFTSEIDGPKLVETFCEMRRRFESEDDVGGMLVLTYVDGEPDEGELIPSITLTLKPYQKMTKASETPETPETP